MAHDGYISRIRKDRWGQPLNLEARGRGSNLYSLLNLETAVFIFSKVLLAALSELNEG
jgi:hypothetical protein